MAKDQSAERRAQAAAVKAEASSARARDRRIKMLGGIGVVVVALGIVVAGYLGAQSAKPHADAAAKQPTGTIAGSYGWPIVPVNAAKSTLTIWEDPQCPFCDIFEKAFGSTVKQLATSGKVNVVYQMATFLDDNFPQSNHASRRALNAFGCAIDQGVGEAYHTLIYANQAKTEGDGFTDDLLRKLGATAGLSGDKLAKFQSCYNDGTYLGCADNLNQYFRDKGIQGTPTLWLDGKVVPTAALASPATLTDYITKNGK